MSSTSQPYPVEACISVGLFAGVLVPTVVLTNIISIVVVWKLATRGNRRPPGVEQAGPYGRNRRSSTLAESNPDYEIPEDAMYPVQPKNAVPPFQANNVGRQVADRTNFPSRQTENGNQNDAFYDETVETPKIEKTHKDSIEDDKGYVRMNFPKAQDKTEATISKSQVQIQRRADSASQIYDSSFSEDFSDDDGDHEYEQYNRSPKPSSPPPLMPKPNRMARDNIL